MTNTIENDLKNINATVWITFRFPNLPNASGRLTPLVKHDTDTAEELIQRCLTNTSNALGKSYKVQGKTRKWRLPIPFFAVPEVLAKDGKTPKPLHYHGGAFVEMENLPRFMEVMPRKWENLLRSEYPKSKPKPLWMRTIDRLDPEHRDKPEHYCLKNTLADGAWTRQCIMKTDDSFVLQIAA